MLLSIKTGLLITLCYLFQVFALKELYVSYLLIYLHFVRVKKPKNTINVKLNFKSKFMKRKLMLLLTCLFIGIGLVTAQTTRVTGTVISGDDGLPVVGASVVVKENPQIGAITDFDGNFVLTNLPAGAKMLQVSYIGMKTVEVPIQEVVKVTMKSDAEVLDQVVVVGYGSAKKLGSVVGSVTAVGNDKLENRPIANVGDALQGQVAGLQVFTPSGEPSESVNMRMRGVSSITGSSEPLFILDGSPITAGTFSSLNPNDIESMTVLKDASSTAVYGARAANGVIVITSKKGKRGEKARVQLSAVYGLSQMTPDKVTMMNSKQWYQFQEMVDPTLAFDDSFQANKKFYVDNGISTDWKEIFFGGVAPTVQADLSVTGGTETINYYFSFGHYGAEGIMDDSDLTRETLRANLESNVNSWLKAGVNLNLAYQDFKTAAFGNAGNSLYNKAFAARVYRPDQTSREILLDEKGNFKGYGKRLDYYDKQGLYNPYYLSELQPTTKTQARLNGNTFVNINPIKGLNIRAAQAIDAFDYRFSYKCLPIGPFAPNAQGEGGGSASEMFQRNYTFTFTNTAEYKFNVANNHNFVILAGQESIQQSQMLFSAEAKGLTDERLMLMSAGTKGEIPGHSVSKQVFNSYFGTFSYNFGDRYFFDASYRRDGSSLFAENNRWGNFYSFGLMWDIKKEAFMRNVSWMNSLSLKGSYGLVGNSSALSAYMALGMIGTGIYNGQTGSAPVNPANPDLTWEVIKSTNIALNTRMFNRLNVDLEFYNRVTDDMLMSIPYSYTTGFGAGWGNVGCMRNRGFDLTVGVDIFNKGDFFWNLTANVNYNKNEIVELFNGLDEYVLAGTGMKLQVGHPYGEYYMVRWAGVDPRDGYDMWYDKNGNLTKNFSEQDAVLVDKQRFAPWSGGFNTTIGWKGLTVSADFSYILNQYMQNNERYFTENPNFAASQNQSADMLNMWTTPGQKTDISRPESLRTFDTRLLENASFLRLKNLSVSYSFPQAWMQRTGFLNSARVFFVGRNLWTITKYKGYDPEVDANVQLGNYPNTRQFSFGVELTF